MGTWIRCRIWVSLLRRLLGAVPRGRFPILRAIFCQVLAGLVGGLRCWIVGLGCRLVRGLGGLDARECGQARWRWLIEVGRGIAWLADHYVADMFRDWSINWSNWPCLRFEGVTCFTCASSKLPRSPGSFSPDLD